LPPAEVEDPRI